jgi:hypothetical protein
MNKTTKKRLREAMAALLTAKNPFIATEAARILCAVEGIRISQGAISAPTPSNVAAQRGLARQHVYERLQRKAEKKRLANRRQYIGRKSAALKKDQQQDRRDSK